MGTNRVTEKKKWNMLSFVVLSGIEEEEPSEKNC